MAKASSLREAALAKASFSLDSQNKHITIVLVVMVSVDSEVIETRGKVLSGLLAGCAVLSSPLVMIHGGYGTQLLVSELKLGSRLSTTHFHGLLLTTRLNTG